MAVVLKVVAVAMSLEEETTAEERREDTQAERETLTTALRLSLFVARESTSHFEQP